MFKIMEPLEKRPDITVEQFHDRWRHPHGTLSVHVPWIQQYVQSHRVNSDLLGDDQSSYEGCTEVWCDNLSDLITAMQDPFNVKHVTPDELEFTVQNRPLYFGGPDEVLTSGVYDKSGRSKADTLWNPMRAATSAKLIQFVKRSGNPDWARPDDAELGKRIGALRHVRSRPARFEDMARDLPRETLAAGQPIADLIQSEYCPFIGVRELWWPTVSAFDESVRLDMAAFEKLLGHAGSSFTMLARTERVK